jgi:hypothetical protein
MSNVTVEPTRFKVFTLEKMVDGLLTLDSENGILTLQHNSGVIAEQQLLSPSEMYVVLALFDNYPDYCPYADILSSATGKSRARCYEMIEAAEENGSVDPVMRPVRNLLGRVRLKLLPFNIKIRSMVHVGYVLIAAKGGMQ